MGSVISKTIGSDKRYRFLPSVNETDFATADWERNPDVSGVSSTPRKYWKYDGSNVVAEMSQAEKDAVEIFIADAQNPIVAGTLGFEKNNICRNKWLGFGAGKPSNVTPFVVPCQMQITALTFINTNNSVETDVEVYKNGTKIYTWEVRDSRWAWKTAEMSTLAFSPGDRIGVFLRDKGTNPRNCIVTIHYTTTQTLVGEGSQPTL